MKLGGAIDARAVASLEGIYPDVFVLGTCGIVAGEGVFASQADEQVFKSRVAERSRSIMTAADADKFVATAPYRIAPFSPEMTLLVEAGNPNELTDIEAAGTRIVRLADLSAGATHEQH